MTHAQTRWRWWLAAPALVLVLTAWCRLHGAATGHEPASFDVIAPWAFKAALGWIIAGALLARFAPAALQKTRHGRQRAGVAVLFVVGIAAFTLASEALLAAEDPLPVFLYEKLPLHLLCAALLVLGYLLLRRKDVRPAVPAVCSQLEVLTGTGRTHVAVQEIECLEADRNYINVHTGERSYLLRQSLASLEEQLGCGMFLRIHRSILVNRAMIRERRAGGVLVLCSGRTVRMSRSYAALENSPPGPRQPPAVL